MSYHLPPTTIHSLHQGTTTVHIQYICLVDAPSIVWAPRDMSLDTIAIFNLPVNTLPCTFHDKTRFGQTFLNIIDEAWLILHHTSIGTLLGADFDDSDADGEEER